VLWTDVAVDSPGQVSRYTCFSDAIAGFIKPLLQPTAPHTQIRFAHVCRKSFDPALPCGGAEVGRGVLVMRRQGLCQTARNRRAESDREITATAVINGWK